MKIFTESKWITLTGSLVKKLSLSNYMFVALNKHVILIQACSTKWFAIYEPFQVPGASDISVNLSLYYFVNF